MTVAFTKSTRYTATNSDGVRVTIPGPFISRVEYEAGEKRLRLPAQSTLACGVFPTLLVEVPSCVEWTESKTLLTPEELFLVLKDIESTASIFETFIIFDRPGTERAQTTLAEARGL